MEIVCFIGLSGLAIVLIIRAWPSSDHDDFAPPKPTEHPRDLPTMRPGDPVRRTAKHQPKRPEQPLRAKYAVMTGKCWVVDGDTIIIAGNRIRLWGIDAPEMDHPFGKTSKFALIALTKGQEVTATFHGSGSFERAVAHVRLPDGRDVAAELVKQGLALDWPAFSGGHYARFEPDGVRKKLWRAHARMVAAEKRAP